MDNLVFALAPAFAAGFALQRLLEILDPILDKAERLLNKRIFLGLLSLFSGFGLARGLGLGVLRHMTPESASVPPLLDYLVTSLIISGGTEGFNAVMKFMSYKKEETKATALTETITAETTSRRMMLGNALARNAPNGSEEIMNSIATNLVRVVSSWSRVELPGFQGGLSLGGLWDQGHLMTIPYDPQGIDKLRAKLRNDDFFKNNPRSRELEHGHFRDGGGIQTQGDLFDFLSS
jgi:hypothetical protein